MRRNATITDAIAAHAAERPDDVCLVMGERRVSWKAFDERIRSVSGWLRGQLPALPKRVVVWVNDPFDALGAFFGVLRMGAAVIPFPGQGAPEFGKKVLEDCRPDCVLVDRQNQDLARALWHGPVACVTDQIMQPDEQSFVVDDNADATIFYSSGTTDRPKGVVHTHAVRRITAERLIWRYALTRNSRTLIMSPLYMAAAISPIVAMAYVGGVSIISERLDADAFIRVLEAERPTSFSITPTQYSLLLDNPAFRPSLFESCDFLQCGGAPLGAALRARLFDMLPDKFVEGYGSTETDHIARTPRHLPPEKRGSVGLPANDLKLRILREDDTPADRPESVGEIAVCSPANLRAYLNTSPDDARYFWSDPASGARYYRTGDLGRLDADGYLWLVDRKKDMIITGGSNIFPSDIETLVARHESVKEVAVVGLPHRVLGETPVAFVVARGEGAGNLSAEICRWANARLGAKQRLQEVRLVPSLPRNASGKVLKRELQR